MRLELVSQKKLIGTYLFACPVDDPVVPGNDWLNSKSVQNIAKSFRRQMSPVKRHLISQPTPEVSSWREILSLQKLDIQLCAIFNACLLLNKIFKYPTT